VGIKLAGLLTLVLFCSSCEVRILPASDQTSRTDEEITELLLELYDELPADELEAWISARLDSLEAEGYSLGYSEQQDATRFQVSRASNGECSCSCSGSACGKKGGR